MRTRRMAALASLAAAVALGSVAVNPAVGVAEPAEGASSMTLSIDENATLLDGGQDVQVSGKYSCAQKSGATISVNVFQGLSRDGIVFGSENSDAACPAENKDWTMKVHSLEGSSHFQAGTAKVSGNLVVEHERTHSHRKVQITG